MKEQFAENGIRYVRAGDYFIPDIMLTDEPRTIGLYGRMRRDYLQTYRPVLYNQLILADKLWTHLADTQEAAQARLCLIIRQMAAIEGVNEEMKELNQMEWVQKMSTIRSLAFEIELNEVIYE